MRRNGDRLHVAIMLLIACVGPASAQSPLENSPSGLITSDDGGAFGYQHNMERSRFVTGSQAADTRRLDENGFSKVVGPKGVFAVDLRNGMAMAVRSGGANKDEPRADDAVSFSMDPDKHNEQVVDYFVTAGIPRDQVGGVHANTYLSASGTASDGRPPVVKVDGYASIVERRIENFAVVDSVAWARMDEQGGVVSERVYWPAIPAQVLRDAKRLEEQTTSGKTEFLPRLSADLPPGKVVIRHSSATEEGPFEVYASYDVLERKKYIQPARDRDQAEAPVVSVTVRHFGVDGTEIRLPQERRSAGGYFPPKQE
jgi:hypothetical protein